MFATFLKLKGHTYTQSKRDQWKYMYILLLYNCRKVS